MVMSVLVIDDPLTVVGPGVYKNMRECPAEVEAGWHFDGTTFAPPTAEEVAAKARGAIRAARVPELPDEIDDLNDRLDRLIDLLESNSTIGANEAAGLKS